MIQRLKTLFLWAVVVTAMVVPIAVATTSPYLAYRSPLYIGAGFAGIIAMSLLLLQPVLAHPNSALIRTATARRWHRIAGTSILVLIIAHVGGLYLVSPPDTVDALMLRAPTLFSLFGVIALWGGVFTAILALTRRKSPLRPRHWKRVHQIIASVVAVATVIHAIQIEGAMEPYTKAILGTAILVATLFAALVDVLRKRAS